MNFILSLIFSFILAYYFEKEFRLFTFKINKQIFQEYNQLINKKSCFYLFLKKSQLKYKATNLTKLFYIFIPIIFILFRNDDICIVMILSVLVYLSFLDSYYFLTDIKYIIFIFISGLVYLLFFQVDLVQENIFSLLFSIILFSSIHLMGNMILKKEVLGLGDSLLIVAISPLFNIEQLMSLLLYASLSGLLFASGYFIIKKYKIQQLPFIPFISLSTFVLFC